MSNDTPKVNVPTDLSAMVADELREVVATLREENARLRKAFVRDFCWQFQDDAPGLRGECAEKIKQGKPCKDCPESWKEARRDEQ